MPPSEPPASVSLPAHRLGFAGAAQDGIVEVAVETPVNIVYGSVPYAVMMATPSDLVDFVRGFSLTEGIIARADDIRDITLRPEADGIVADVRLAPERFRAHLARRRNLSGRTGCGLCGIESLAELPFAPQAVTGPRPVPAASLARALASLERHQPLHLLTRAVHAAAWCDEDGAILAVREDVGRHNALDKLIGARLPLGPDRRGFILVTSRASFEMVEKAAIFGAGTLAAISAPTSLAIDRARALGLTLAAIARPDGATIFAGALACTPNAVTPGAVTPGAVTPSAVTP
jgi:FdhD protein